MNLDAALETYVEESRDMLRSMEAGLLDIEQLAGDAEAINALFRAAHTIKGSAGLFGLDGIVGFTHGVESALDHVREGTLAIDASLAALLLECCDHITQLVDDVANGQASGTAHQAVGEALQLRLDAAVGGTAGSTATTARVVPDADASSGSSQASSDYWHISVRFGGEVLRNGMDPLSFVRYLRTLGEAVFVHADLDAMPAAEAMDPEQCYVALEIGLRTTADRQAIESVFEFVREDCTLDILPPRSRAKDYVALIQSLPEGDVRLGELLVRAGALTREQLAAGLDAQRRAADATPADALAKPLGQILVDEQLVSAPVVQAALDRQQQAKDPQARDSKGQESRFIRMDANKLDYLINRIGELVITGAGIGLVSRRLGSPDLQELASTLSTLVADVRESALKLRMVPIGATFSRFQRVVHDVARELGKDIALEVSGGETELDKTMVDRIGDPLMHLVRNAMDHGIEPTDVRIARGKPARGTVGLSACHDAGSIVLEISDDGGGLSRERILAKAIERGLLPEGANPGDREVFDLVFEPGFSTAEKVSNLSGRGVGMDVVKRSILDLRGSVEIDSTPGRGTIVRIRLPLTLAIIDGFLVRVGESVFVVPLDMVDECIEVSASARAERRADRSGRNLFNLRGSVLPVIDMRETFALGGGEARRENILVVRYAGQLAGLVVDELMGEAQTVIKPLGKMFRAVQGIGGSTILGDGRVALILDVPSLLERAHGAHNQTHRQTERPIERLAAGVA